MITLITFKRYGTGCQIKCGYVWRPNFLHLGTYLDIVVWKMFSYEFYRDRPAKRHISAFLCVFTKKSLPDKQLFAVKIEAKDRKALNIHRIIPFRIALFWTCQKLMKKKNDFFPKEKKIMSRQCHCKIMGIEIKI